MSKVIVLLLPKKSSRQVQMNSTCVFVISTASMVYFEKLEIHSVKMNISLYTPPYREKDDEYAIYKLIGGIVPAVPNIDSAPLKLNALVNSAGQCHQFQILEHPFTTADDLFSRISSHYVTQIIKGSYRLLGSFEFLGNPGTDKD